MGTEERQSKSIGKAKTGGDQNVMSGQISSGGISIQGRNAHVTIHQSQGGETEELSRLFKQLYEHIDSRPPDPNVDKEEIIETVQKIQQEASKDQEVNETKLSRWFDNLNKMAPDVIDVALASLGGPVSGITAVLKKIADHAHQQSKP